MNAAKPLALLLTFAVGVSSDIASANLITPSAIYDSSGPAYPGGGDNGTSDPTYAANKAIDGNLGTFTCLVDDTLAGSSTATTPDNAAAPVTGHIIFDLGKTMVVSAAKLISRTDSAGPLNPKDVNFFCFIDDDPTNNTLVDDIDNDSDIVAISVGAQTEITLPGLSSGASHTETFDASVVKRYLGLRVNSSYESGATHYNFQIAEMQFEASPVPEPSTWAMVIIGTIMLAAWRRH